MMTEPYLAYRTMPELDQAAQQLITNLQQQNRALAADRDRYAALMTEARAKAEQISIECSEMRYAMQCLWNAYIPEWSPAVALSEHFSELNNEFKHIAKILRENTKM